MNKEIELKAHVDDPQQIREILTVKYGQPSGILKDDIYYYYNVNESTNPTQAVRLRKENGENVVTLKRKEVNNGIEINDELEFKVDNASNFLQFMKLTGACEWVAKKKRGWKFVSTEADGDAVIELCEVSSLGWFIEIEVVIESPEKSRIAGAERKIRDILKSVGISEARIEPKYYSEMLMIKKDPPDSTNRTGKGG